MDETQRMSLYPAQELGEIASNNVFQWTTQGAKNNSCDKCNTVGLYFEHNILPLFNLHCYACHGFNPLEGIKITNYHNIVDAVNNHNLKENILYDAGYPGMAPLGKINDCELNQMHHWIESGMSMN